MAFHAFHLRHPCVPCGALVCLWKVYLNVSEGSGGLKLNEASLWPEGHQFNLGGGKWKALLAPPSLPPLRSPWARPLTPTAPVKLPSGEQVTLWLYWTASSFMAFLKKESIALSETSAVINKGEKNVYVRLSFSFSFCQPFHCSQR